MTSKNINVLIIGNLMGSSIAFELFPNYTFLYWSGRFNIFNKGFEAPNGIRFNPFNYIKQIKSIIKKRGIDIIYFYTDQRMKIYNDYGVQIFKTDFGVPKVFGFHNHHLLTGDRERDVLRNADGYVFLNHESFDFYRNKFDLKNPVFFIPSLYLPKRSSYNIETLSKLSDNDGELHVGMGGRFVTCEVDEKGECSKEVEEIHRYDFSFIARGLSSLKIHSHIYGDFKEMPNKNLNKGSRIKPSGSNETKGAYLSLAESPYIHLEGLTNKFEEQLSKYDLFICKGILTGGHIPEFEHMNYQLRFNSALAAGLPLLVAKDTDRTLEREIEKHGGGIIFDSFEDLQNQLRDKGAKELNREIEKLREIHSFDYWVEPISKFFIEVLHASKNS